ncbi:MULTISPECIES: TonB-dependent receptor domain-containing protein [unclassified Sphingomonas]|jgi:outer membrane receptor protein involved in Fe transport|uniref:TonB-dependent receptor domain-containing protein n=1 Tax=unclassified Sphingomonas TaxID=196159 RepID=UPI0008377ED8|nr:MULTISPECIES: TonB-dependent receptor [unclassified Sphingomonas]
MLYSRNAGLMAGCAAVALSMSLIAVPAHAQQTPAAPAEPQAETPETQTDQDQRDEAIVVTGSRIVSPNATSIAPVQTTTIQQITDSGITNVQELLLENPVFGAPTFARTNTAFLTSGTGVASIDLRNLGTARTLVLINGRRVVSGVPGSATVDTNVIPTQFLQSVDTLTGGSSSIYGSDAVAGVVNFIYRDNFEGLEANAQYGITERGDDPRYQANITFGANLADGRGNIMLHAGYSNEGGLLSRRRRNTVLDDIDTFLATGENPADYGTPLEPFLSGFAPQGRFTAGGQSFTYDPQGNLQTGFNTNVNGFNRQFFRTIAVPVERYLFAGRAHYDVTDSVRVYAEGTFNNTSSSREIEPFALGSENIFPASGGLVPIETFVNGVAVLNPLVPGAIAAAAQDEDGDGLRDISFARRLSDIGTRNGSTSRDFYRFVVGLEGDLFDNRFRWDVFYNYGRTSESQISNGQVNVLNFANALAAIPDVNDLNNNGSTTDAVCASATARAQGCVPINVFGAGSITPEAAQYVQAPQSFQTRITQQQIQGSLSGELFDLPAGPLGIAVGAEYRKESSTENNDALTNAGLNGGNAIPDTAGSFDVREVFGELRIPVLADTPFFKSLNLTAAGRISDYSTVGTVYTWNVGGDWEPFDGLRVRGTYARSVRAPNIGELFTGPSQTFPTGLQDPCEGIGATGGGTIGDNCRAAPGVLANIAANGTFTLTQPDVQGISGFNSGNPDLNEEKSRSYTFGAVLAPRQLGGIFERLSLSVDYFNIDVEDYITSAPRQFTLAQCYEAGDQDFCDLIQRRATPTASNSAGSLEFIDAPLINGGSAATEGIDAVVTWNTPVRVLSDTGTIGLRVAYTHLLKGYVIPLEGGQRDDFAGEIGSAKDRFTASFNYADDDFRWNVTGTYIGRSAEDDLTLEAYGLEAEDITVPAQFYLDTQLSWTAAKTYEFYVGVDNLLDNDAPNILSGSVFNVTGTDTAAGVYDVFGRRFYAGGRIRF